jgi:hypothetical protein
MSNSNISWPDEKVLPEAEQAECKHIAWLLRLLNSYREDFEAALELVIDSNRKVEALRAAEEAARKAKDQQRDAELRKASKLRSAWHNIAIRDAVMSVYHFQFILNGILKSTHRCPTLIGKIDLEKLHTAQPLFKKHFPKTEGIRHAVAHAGETQHSLRRLEQARYDGTLQLGGITAKGIASGHIIYGWTMHMTHEKKLVSMEVSPAKNEQLKSVVEAVFEAFRSVQPQPAEGGEPLRGS